MEVNLVTRQSTIQWARDILYRPTTNQPSPINQSLEWSHCVLSIAEIWSSYHWMRGQDEAGQLPRRIIAHRQWRSSWKEYVLAGFGTCPWTRQPLASQNQQVFFWRSFYPSLKLFIKPADPSVINLWFMGKNISTYWSVIYIDTHLIYQSVIYIDLCILFYFCPHCRSLQLRSFHNINFSFREQWQNSQWQPVNPVLMLPQTTLRKKPTGNREGCSLRDMDALQFWFSP